MLVEITNGSWEPLSIIYQIVFIFFLSMFTICHFSDMVIAEEKDKRKKSCAHFGLCLAVWAFAVFNWIW